MRSPAGSRRVAFLIAATSLATTACVQPVPRVLTPLPGPRTQPQPTDHAEISLRLGAHEGAASLAVTGSAKGDLEFHREGPSIRCSNGALRREFVIRPRARTLFLGERSYPGALRVAVRPDGGLRAEVHLDLEEYVTGVVAGELPLLRAFPAELEAQAIAARSFALTRWAERRRGGQAPFVWDDTRDQVYVGPQVLHSSAEREARTRLEAAVFKTRGQILVRRDELFDARYHAACGGSTSALSAIPGSASVSCPGCRDGSITPTDWSFTANPEELTQVAISLGIGDRLEIMRPNRARDDGRWGEVYLRGNTGSLTASVSTLRSLLGADRFASNLVLRTWPHPGKEISSGLFIEGRGRGHGVGMCQEGAHELARREWSRARILKHYYPGTSTQHWTLGALP